MVFVIGNIRVEPTERDAFIANMIPLMKHSRAEAGCVTYAFTADPIEADLVVLTERWTDRAALDAHLAGLPAAPQPSKTPTPLARELFIYEGDDGTKL
jgi:quinol monooxygenase YgiN